MNLAATRSSETLSDDIAEKLSIRDGDGSIGRKKIAIESEVGEAGAGGRANDVVHKTGVDSVEEGLESTNGKRGRAKQEDHHLLDG